MKKEEDTPVDVSLETLVRHVSEASRRELSTLRATLDQQISAIDARLGASNHRPAIDATVAMLARATRERIDMTVAQTSAAHTELRMALDSAKQQLASAKATVAATEADRKVLVEQHRDVLNEKDSLAAALDQARVQLLDVQVRLTHAQQETRVLAAEGAELKRRLGEASAGRTTAEAKYQQLVTASQKLTDALSQTLHQQHEHVRAIAAVPLMRDDVGPGKSAKTLPPTNPPTNMRAVAAQKPPTSFSERARDAKRVRIRRGMPVSVDGIPGELVDLSIGGAQIVLTQSVKPNQLVQLVLQGAAGELVCKGRIVWALYERPEISLSVYRTGVKFRDVDAVAVEGFMNDFGEQLLAPSDRSSEIA